MLNWLQYVKHLHFLQIWLQYIIKVAEYLQGWLKYAKPADYLQNWLQYVRKTTGYL